MKKLAHPSSSKLPLGHYATARRRKSVKGTGTEEIATRAVIEATRVGGEVFLAPPVSGGGLGVRAQ